MTDTSNLTFAIPARVLRSVGTRQADLLTLAKERVPDAAYLDEHEPFFWAAEISSDVIDAYYTHMLPSTLVNFAADAKTGVAFLPGHQHRELPFGYSLDSQMENATEPERTRVVADFYTLAGLKLNDIDTDHLIRGIRGGLIRDVSVGFHGGQTTCDICGRDIWDWDCMHVPGLEYKTKRGDEVETVISTFSIDGARLSEVSAVFDGATPCAGILKAEREAAEGRMRPDAVQIIEQRYRVKLPVKRQFTGNTFWPERNNKMDFEQLVNQLREAMGVAEPGDLPGAVAALSAEVTRLKPLEAKLTDAQARIATLEPQAADGVEYRNGLVADALAEGVRAKGEKFNGKEQEETLRKLSIADIKERRDFWADLGNSRFVGGRKTTDDGEQAPNSNGQRKGITLPATAHKV